VINLSSLDPDVADTLFFEGRDILRDAAELEAAAEARRRADEQADKFDEEASIKAAELGGFTEREYEAFCEAEVDRMWEAMGYEDQDDYENALLDILCDEINIYEPIIEGTHEGITYRIDWLGGAPLVWVLEGHVVGRFDLCSPCVPNACSLDSPNPDGFEGYDVPADWRRDNGEA
jgi:hypothetical protein